jgi:hypothetical protein
MEKEVVLSKQLLITYQPFHNSKEDMTYSNNEKYLVVLKERVELYPNS